MTQQAEALKPCPFCSGRAEFNEHDADCYFTKLAELEASKGSADMGLVLELREAWNRRATAQLATFTSELATLSPELATQQAVQMPEPELIAYRGIEPVNFYTEQQVRAMVAAMAAPGWQLVPVEPTKEMLDAYVNLAGRFQSGRSDWEAMVAAAPTPPAQERKPLTPNEVSGLLESAGYWPGDMTRADFINGLRYGEMAHSGKHNNHHSGETQ